MLEKCYKCIIYLKKVLPQIRFTALLPKYKKILVIFANSLSEYNLLFAFGHNSVKRKLEMK